MPLDEALPIARQIAEALEAAHERGIIHRDLKPANIKVRADGAVKVLDFGLAKALDPLAARRGARRPASNSRRRSRRRRSTQMGVILGTAAYMAPEQAKGKAVDKRADIWAFGVVLYEMLTGRALFDGETSSETLAAVIRADDRPARAAAGHAGRAFAADRPLPRTRSAAAAPRHRRSADPPGGVRQPLQHRNPPAWRACRTFAPRYGLSAAPSPAVSWCGRWRAPARQSQPSSPSSG